MAGRHRRPSRWFGPPPPPTSGPRGAARHTHPEERAPSLIDDTRPIHRADLAQLLAEQIRPEELADLLGQPTSPAPAADTPETTP